MHWIHVHCAVVHCYALFLSKQLFSKKNTICYIINGLKIINLVLFMKKCYLTLFAYMCTPWPPHCTTGQEMPGKANSFYLVIGAQLSLSGLIFSHPQSALLYLTQCTLHNAFFMYNYLVPYKSICSYSRVFDCQYINACLFVSKIWNWKIYSLW